MHETLLTAIIAQSREGLFWGVIFGVFWAAIGVLAGLLVVRWLTRTRLEGARNEAERKVGEAQANADVIRKTAEVDAKAKYLDGQEQLRSEAQEMRAEFKGIEKRLAKREDNLEGKLDTLATKERNLEQIKAKLEGRLDQVGKREEKASQLVAERRENLLRIAKLTPEEASRVVLDELAQELEHEAAEMIDKAVGAAKDEAMRKHRVDG